MADDQTQKDSTATEEGLDNQAEELQDKHETNTEEASDPRDPEEWRDIPKTGGGA